MKSMRRFLLFLSALAIFTECSSLHGGFPGYKAHRRFARQGPEDLERDRDIASPNLPENALGRGDL